MNALTPDLLLIIDAIARHGSFAKAARELDRVPSAITYSVRRLEESLDVLLFDRSAHRARLTPAGDALLQDGRHILEAMEALTRRVQRVATGWEAELRIAVSAVLDWQPLYDLIDDFHVLKCGTRLRFSVEVLSGNWDALTSGRADIVIGADAGMAASGDYRTQPLGISPFVFCVAPHHPLAQAAEPLSKAAIQAHYAIVVGDTSRYIAPQTRGLLQSQDMLIMPTMQAKIDAQIRGLGCGYVPRALADPYLAQGLLLARETESGHPLPESLVVAWNKTARGEALKWWLKQLNAPRLRAAMLGELRSRLPQQPETPP